MDKQSAAKVSTPPQALPNDFLLGGRTCEIIRIHEPADRNNIDIKTIIKRGKVTGADMHITAGSFMHKHRDEIPLVYSQTIFVFPMWTGDKEGEDDGFIRALNRRGGVDWWCLMKYPSSMDWDTGCRLVRFRNLALPLPAIPKPNLK